MNDDLEKAGWLGLSIGILLTALTFAIYMNLMNMQPLPNCINDSLLMEITEDELACVPRAKFR